MILFFTYAILQPLLGISIVNDVGVNQTTRDPLRLNVGFLLHQSVGFSRIFEFEVPSVEVGGELQVKDLSGDVRLTRTAPGLYLEGVLFAVYPMECSRCLTTFDQVLAPKLGDLFVYPPEKAEDPILKIAESGVLDLHPYLREMMLLDIPIQPVCQPGCRGLCSVCGNNLNEETCDHPEQDIDPRMAPLKTLLSE